MWLLRSVLVVALLGTVAFADDHGAAMSLEDVIKSGGEAFAEVMLAQDKAQRLCSEHKNQLPTNLMGEFLKEQKALITYPESGELLGDWEKGQALFSNPKTGNCYACHAADPDELAAGNVAPGLTNYGVRGMSDPIIEYTYNKIYNAWSLQPCSSMYRAGVNGRLTPEETADIVAFLLTPASPINPDVP